MICCNKNQQELWDQQTTLRPRYNICCIGTSVFPKMSHLIKRSAHNTYLTVALANIPAETFLTKTHFIEIFSNKKQLSKVELISRHNMKLFSTTAISSINYIFSAHWVTEFSFNACHRSTASHEVREENTSTAMFFFMFCSMLLCLWVDDNMHLPSSLHLTHTGHTVFSYGFWTLEEIAALQIVNLCLRLDVFFKTTHRLFPYKGPDFPLTCIYSVWVTGIF